MKRRFTEKEAAAILKQMGILADTREQVWDHVKKSLESLKCPVERGKLDQGDYTAFVPMNAFPGCGGVPGITSLQEERFLGRCILPQLSKQTQPEIPLRQPAFLAS